MPRGEIDEAWIEEAVRRYRRIETLQAEFDQAVATVEVTVRSPDGLVEVVVTAGGRITDVRFLGPLHQRNPRDVAGSVQAAVTAAADAAQWAREKLHNETFAAYRPLAGA
ncbi:MULTISPECIES: YbaB/EbfC family nucleoid-associated protein [Micromonospora]|uniref:YbaB/EbfC DNA-binding family protein n=2 Tax=Micromonospora TaxID=1873 RepID=A0A1C4VPQ1_9ACTN|nr:MULTISPECIES: YbaB/EbfC family nucleoid-associated protein [Micromonospora]KAB1913504.1 YbaB/EbfC family nucleoid-associated protein [Micromonospora sp. AMSO31t]SBT50979.1 YbaB/EbfC DNA-binding family protein [Micromonospora auratinigra]SCE85943.1 YbaB/EbfC DNA-binding family protein [Micromonospora chaiyaphumensis]